MHGLRCNCRVTRFLKWLHISNRKYLGGKRKRKTELNLTHLHTRLFRFESLEAWQNCSEEKLFETFQLLQNDERTITE